MKIKLRIMLMLSKIRASSQVVLQKLGISGLHRARMLRNLLCSKLMYQLRTLATNSSEKPFSHSEDVIRLVTIYLIFPKVLDKNFHAFLLHIRNSMDFSNDEIERMNLCYEKHRDAVDGILNDVGKSEHIAKTVATYFQIQSFINSREGNDRSQEIFMDLALKKNPRALELDSKSISRLLRSTRKELRILKRVMLNRNAARLPFSGQYITAVLSATSALFLVSGYLYSRSFLGAFDIDVKHYLSLSDYIGASIEGLRHAFIAVLGALAGGLIEFHNRSQARDSQIGKIDSGHDQYSWFIVLMSFIITLITYISESIYYYYSIVVFIFMILIKLIDAICYRYVADRHWQAMRFFILIFLIFSLSLWASVRMDIYEIKHMESDDIKRYNIALKTAVDIDVSNAVLLASTSRYLFLRDGISSKILIVPTSQIESISVRQR